MTNYILPAMLLGAALSAVTHAAGSAHYVQAPGGSLTFTFVQAGAESQGSFEKFVTELSYDQDAPVTGALKVTVQTGSLDTQDKDRDEALAGDELFDVARYPSAQFVAGSFTRRADGQLEAVGKLTLRGVTRQLRIPLTIRATANGVEISGAATLKRLDYGVGQGEWKSTDWVGDEVKLQYRVPLTKAK